MSPGDPPDPAAAADAADTDPADAAIAANAQAIGAEIAWFEAVLAHRLEMHRQGVDAPGDILTLCPPPPLDPPQAPYAKALIAAGLGPAERLIVILAALPHFAPRVLDPFFIENRALGRRFTEFGGLSGTVEGGFQPTAETALFLLAGGDLAARLRHRARLGPAHPLFLGNVLRLVPQTGDTPGLNPALQLSEEYLERLTSGQDYWPGYSASFPAEHLDTAYAWDDLCLDRATMERLGDIVTWIRKGPALMRDWGLKGRVTQGYRALFYGPPGTGKTMTASLLGKVTGLPVFRVDLSRVVSKYIGETEKNLASLFDQAAHRRWILFFDEADSLFGKRTETRNANDRAANQQVSYLLQRIEDFPGVVILATNLRANIDDAFARRFQAMVHFPLPDAAQRLKLWRAHFENRPYRLADDVDLARLAQDHDLSGGNIVNVLRHACVKAIQRDPPVVQAGDIARAIAREAVKEGKLPG